MIEVYLYGEIKTIVEQSTSNVSSIMLLDYIEGEQLQDFIHRLGLNLEDIGDCYVNNDVAGPDCILHNSDTIELNPRSK